MGKEVKEGIVYTDDGARSGSGGEAGTGSKGGRSDAFRMGVGGWELMKLRASSDSPSNLLSFVFLRFLALFASTGVGTSGGIFEEDLLNPNLM